MKLWKSFEAVFQPTHKIVLEKLIVEFTEFGSDSDERSE
jgi:hypothetical protein